jgi:teichuronic acid biosynthesis glycosyltransferase TuaC
VIKFTTGKLLRYWLGSRSGGIELNRQHTTQGAVHVVESYSTGKLLFGTEFAPDRVHGFSSSPSHRLEGRYIPAKLHVLTLTPFYPFEENESNGCYVSEPLREVDDRGIASSVFAVEPIYRRRRRPSRRFPAEWIQYPQIPGTLGMSSSGKFLGAILINRVRRLHQQFPVNLIHAHAALPCGYAAAHLSRHLGIPFVVTVHGLDVFNSCLREGIATGWRHQASSNVYRSARKVICVSEKVRNLLTKEMGAEVAAEVVYNGADPVQFAPGPGEGPTPTLLVVGTLSPIKGHELVLRALVRLVESHPGLQCRIIGEGSEEKRLMSLAKDLGINDRVHFLGWRSRDEVASAMRECTVFVLPSRYEGLGCVYLEAMACGRPVIGCHGQGIDEVIEHSNNGWIIPVGGLDELTQGLRSLLNSFELRAQIGQRARQTILDKFTLSRQADKLVNIYQEVLQ